MVYCLAYHLEQCSSFQLLLVFATIYRYLPFSVLKINLTKQIFNLEINLWIFVKFFSKIKNFKIVKVQGMLKLYINILKMYKRMFLIKSLVTWTTTEVSINNLTKWVEIHINFRKHLTSPLSIIENSFIRIKTV